MECWSVRWLSICVVCYFSRFLMALFHCVVKLLDRALVELSETKESEPNWVISHMIWFLNILFSGKLAKSPWKLLDYLRRLRNFVAPEIITYFAPKRYLYFSSFKSCNLLQRPNKFWVSTKDKRYVYSVWSFLAVVRAGKFSHRNVFQSLLICFWCNDLQFWCKDFHLLNSFC